MTKTRTWIVIAVLLAALLAFCAVPIRTSAGPLTQSVDEICALCQIPLYG